MILRVAHLGFVGTATEWYVSFFIYASLLAYPPLFFSNNYLESALTEITSYFVGFIVRPQVLMSTAFAVATTSTAGTIKPTYTSTSEECAT